MDAQIGDVFPVLQQRRAGRRIDPNVEAARRVLLSAYQRGGLTEEELYSTLDRLEFASTVQAESRDALWISAQALKRPTA